MASSDMSALWQLRSMSSCEADCCYVQAILPIKSLSVGASSFLRLQRGLILQFLTKRCASSWIFRKHKLRLCGSSFCNSLPGAVPAKAMVWLLDAFFQDGWKVSFCCPFYVCLLQQHHMHTCRTARPRPYRPRLCDTVRDDDSAGAAPAASASLCGLFKLFRVKPFEIFSQARVFEAFA